jgi:hypothetical protein
VFGLLAGVALGTGVGWCLRSRFEQARYERMRQEIMKEIRRQERAKARVEGLREKCVQRHKIDRLLREADEEFEERHGE